MGLDAHMVRSTEVMNISALSAFHIHTADQKRIIFNFSNDSEWAGHGKEID